MFYLCLPDNVSGLDVGSQGGQPPFPEVCSEPITLAVIEASPHRRLRVYGTVFGKKLCRLYIVYTRTRNCLPTNPSIYIPSTQR